MTQARLTAIAKNKGASRREEEHNWYPQEC